MTHSHRRIRGMVLCALFTALTAVCSQIAIPTPWGVPINLALFAVYLAGAMLGPVRGFVSQLAFLALAAFGVPVLAGFQGGPAAVFGPTGGYVIGYLAAALVVGLLAGRFGRTAPRLCGYMVLGCAACYLFGTLWFMVLMQMDFFAALALCVVPYLPCDAVKIALAAVLVRALDRRLPDLRRDDPRGQLSASTAQNASCAPPTKAELLVQKLCPLSAKAECSFFAPRPVAFCVPARLASGGRGWYNGHRYRTQGHAAPRQNRTAQKGAAPCPLPNAPRGAAGAAARPAAARPNARPGPRRPPPTCRTAAPARQGPAAFLP